MRLGVIVAAMLTLGLSFCTVSPTERLALFVLAGQSNMSGRAPLQDPSDVPDARIWLFGNDDQWRLAEEPLDSAEGQVDAVSIDPEAALGPGLFFARALLDKSPDMRIGLIPCARGGSGLSEWTPDASSETLYGSCLRRIRLAEAQGSLSGVLFHQGETDALNMSEVPDVPRRTTDWAEGFSLLVRAWRADTHDSQLPIVFGQIGRTDQTGRFPGWETVRAEQASVSLPCVMMVQTDDLPLVDGLHLSADGVATLGVRFAEAYVSLAPCLEHDAAPTLE